jgi:hypothetical protein
VSLLFLPFFQYFLWLPNAGATAQLAIAQILLGVGYVAKAHSEVCLRLPDEAVTKVSSLVASLLYFTSTYFFIVPALHPFGIKLNLSSAPPLWLPPPKN